jgi:FdhE protein
VAGRIAKLLHRQTPERPEVGAAIAALSRLAEVQPDLRHAAAVQAALLRILYAGRVPALPYTLTADAITARLAGGVPLLRNAALPCTEHDLRALFVRLCAAASNAGAAFLGESASLPYTGLAEAAQKGRLALWDWGHMLLAGAAQTLPARLEAQGHPADLVMTLLRFTLLPFLEQSTAQLMHSAVGQPWGRGYCSLCGAWPVLAEQRGLEQLRYLRCGFCANSWEVDHLLCPFCTNRDHLLLGYLQVEGEEQKQRIATCDACQSYLKLRSTLTPLTTPQLLVEEVALVHLDLIAMEKGYLPPA